MNTEDAELIAKFHEVLREGADKCVILLGHNDEGFHIDRVPPPAEFYDLQQGFRTLFEQQLDQPAILTLKWNDGDCVAVMTVMPCPATWDPSGTVIDLNYARHADEPYKQALLPFRHVPKFDLSKLKGKAKVEKFHARVKQLTIRQLVREGLPPVPEFVELSATLASLKSAMRISRRLLDEEFDAQMAQQLVEMQRVIVEFEGKLQLMKQSLRKSV
jgi:hypothetical protein